MFLETLVCRPDMKRFQMCTTTKYKHNFIPSILIVISLLIYILLLVHTTYSLTRWKIKSINLPQKISYNICTTFLFIHLSYYSRLRAAVISKIKRARAKRRLTQREETDGGKTEFSGARWRPRTGHFTTYTVLSFEAS